MKAFNFKRLIASLLTVAMLVWAVPSQAAITFVNSNTVGPYSVGGNSKMVTGKMDLSGTYATGGFSLSPSKFGLSVIQQVILQAEDGYSFFWDAANGKVMVFQGAAGTPSGTVGSTSAGTPAGTVAAPTFTGTASTTGEVSAFTGTGQSSSGQVITTTDNQTMTLNEAAGMWFISATHGPYFIVSNTAVSGAPAVLTVIGDAPTTDAGAYRIVKSPTPVGTNSAPAFTGSALATHTHTFTGDSGGGGAATEVANSTSLASVDQVNFVVIGY